MSEPRAFEWDDAKALSNFAKPGIEFAYATIVFLEPGRIALDVSRAEDREMRRKSIGLDEGRLLTVVYTTRPGTMRIISVRRSNSIEGRVYGSLHT